MPFHDAALQQVIPVLRISSLEGFAGAAHRSTNSCGVLVYTKYVPRRTDDAVPPSPRAGCVTTVYLHPGVDTCTNVLFSLSRCFLCSPFTTSYTHDTHTHLFRGPYDTKRAHALRTANLIVELFSYLEPRTRIRHTYEYTIDGCIAAERVARAATAVYSRMDFAPPSTHTINMCPVKSCKTLQSEVKRRKKRCQTLQSEVKRCIALISA